MGLDGRLDVLVPGLRVRHTGDLWIGTVRHVMPAGNTIKVQPEGTDQERWFDADEFEPWADVPPSEAIRRRYLTDPVFHQLVTYQRQLLQLARQLRGDDAAQDLVDAGGLAVEMEREIAIRRGDAVRGRSPVQDVKDHLAAFDQVTAERAAGDDVRGKGQTDAQERRGTHGSGQQKP
jgi:hypothetical protein